MPGQTAPSIKRMTEATVSVGNGGLALWGLGTMIRFCGHMQNAMDITAHNLDLQHSANAMLFIGNLGSMLGAGFLCAAVGRLHQLQKGQS